MVIKPIWSGFVKSNNNTFIYEDYISECIFEVTFERTDEIVALASSSSSNCFALTDIGLLYKVSLNNLILYFEENKLSSALFQIHCIDLRKANDSNWFSVQCNCKHNTMRLSEVSEDRKIAHFGLHFMESDFNTEQCEKKFDFVIDCTNNNAYLANIRQTSEIVLFFTDGDERNSLKCIEFCLKDKRDSLCNLACGFAHVVLLTSFGSVYTFGCGGRGELGYVEQSLTLESVVPQIVAALDGLKICQICCGGWHTAVVSDAGDCFIWGWNQAGQIGPISHQGTVCFEPQLIELPAEGDDVAFLHTSVLKVACGSRHTAILTESRQVWLFGWNRYGQIDDDMLDYDGELHKLVVPNRYSNKTVVDVMCGPWTTIVVYKQDCEIHC